MIVTCFEPPPPLLAGGLGPAIHSLEAFLKNRGVRVRTNPPLKSIGRVGSPEIVHFHSLWRPWFSAASAICRRRGVPYVVSPHGMLEPWAWRHKSWKKRPWFSLIEKRHLAGAARLLATSEAEARNLTRLVPAARAVAIPLGLLSDHGPDYLRARQDLGWADSEIVLLFLSRLHVKKGLHLLLEALTRCTETDRSRVRLVIVGGGDGHYVAEIKSLAAGLAGELPRIDWAGEILHEGKWAYFQGADLFCLPSFSENFGLAVLEALQVGTRVLTTTETPWEDVPSWNGGFVVAPEVGAIADALRTFLASPDWPLNMRDDLASFIHQRFSWANIGPRYLDFYNGIVTSSAEPSMKANTDP